MAELRNIKWSRLLKDLTSRQSLEILLKSKSLQWALTYCLRQQNHIALNELEDLILEYKGIRYKPHPLNYPRIFEAYDRYKIEELRPDDVVLDLGANIGSFSLPAAKVVEKVIAVEPLFSRELEENSWLNYLDNIWVYKNSIGTTEVDCQEYKGKAEITNTLPTYATFVRMDIGGAEWLIKPDTIITPRVRHFEGEFHFWTKKQRKNSKYSYGLRWWLSVLELNGLNYTLRWSRHHHWAYVSADKSYKESKEVQLQNGSFEGGSKRLWKLNFLI